MIYLSANGILLPRSIYHVSEQCLLSDLSLSPPLHLPTRIHAYTRTLPSFLSLIFTFPLVTHLVTVPMTITSDTRKPYNGNTRSLVLAFDVGTTFSGVSYAILEPNEIPKIHGVTRCVLSFPLIYMSHRSLDILGRSMSLVATKYRPSCFTIEMAT